MDTERITVGGTAKSGAPYAQIQNGPRGSRVLRHYRFDK